MNRSNARSAVAVAVAVIALTSSALTTRATDPAPVVSLSQVTDHRTTATGHVVSPARLRQQPSPRRARALVLDAPRSVSVGSAITVRGRTGWGANPRGAGRSEVVRLVASLVEILDGGRATVDSTRVRRSGAFRLDAPASAVAGRRVFRITVRTRGGGAARKVTTSLVVRNTPSPVAVAPTPAPAIPAAGSLGDSQDWTYIGSDPRLVTRWDPCSTITWSYDATGEYAGALGDMTTALARISAVSGLDFSYVGASGGKITVSWSDAARTPALAGTTVGLGGVSSFRVDPGLNNGTARQVVAGHVTLDREADLLPGHSLTGKTDWGQVMVHEAMHAIGLGHAAENTQVLYPWATAKVFGAGDWAGMVAVGASQGCLAPIPGYARVAATPTVAVN